MREFFLRDDQLPRLLEVIGEQYDVVFFTETGPVAWPSGDDGVDVASSLRGPRSTLPAKSFFLPVREHLADYGVPGGQPDGNRAARRRPPALVNLRNCDVQALEILDQVFLSEGDADPFYRRRREHAFLVSVDCAAITEYCFCTTVGTDPAVDQGSDLNLSGVDGGFVVRAGSSSGDGILGRMEGSGRSVEEAHRQQATAGRAVTEAALQQSNERFAGTGAYHEILLSDAEPERWVDLFSTCVECGGCTNICPTCYCFYMFDRSKALPARGYEKLRSWDSCLLADYSRMGGGPAKPNPRPRLRSRYENRFRHKYEYHYQTHGRYGCTGCGRCAQACMGATDPREVMRVLSQ